MVPRRRRAQHPGQVDIRMPNQIRVPSRIDLTGPTLEALHLLGGSASVSEIDLAVPILLELADEVVNLPHGGGPRTEIEYRLAWARSELKKYGLVDNSSRGVWALTLKGKETENIDPREVERANREADRMRRQTIIPPTNNGDEVSVDDISEDLGEETTSWEEQLTQVLLSMSPDAFERLCRRLLRESGFIEVEVTGRSGDGGIDGHGILRMGGLISFPVVFQCKLYRKNVPAEEVRAFRGALARQGVTNGLLITTSNFTRQAKEEVVGGTQNIDLIHGSLLADKLKELGLGIKTEMVEQVTVDADWFHNI